MLAEESRDDATVDWVQGLNPEGKKTICFYLPFKNLLNCAWFHGVKIFKVNDYIPRTWLNMSIDVFKVNRKKMFLWLKDWIYYISDW